MGERIRKRQLRKWRRRWALRASAGLKRRRLQRRLGMCLAAALMAEGLWFALQAVSADAWREERWLESGEEGSRLIRGLRFQIEDGKLQLFQIQEQVQPDEGRAAHSD